MIVGKKTLFPILLGLDFLANILELTHFNFLFISTLISFCTYILLPGFLISLILRIKKISFWENLLIIGGLSITFLEFGGLLLNILLPLVGIKDPLAFQNLFIGFNIYVLLLFIFGWIRTKSFVAMTSLQVSFPRCSRVEKILYSIPVFFPMLATLGAIVLNNGGSNILTLILLGTIAFYSFLLVLLRDKISTNLYPYAIFFIGMASLFTTSLRSWYIAGADIQAEFYVFRLANEHHIWNMAFYQNAYNACLSITILPTVLTNFLSIQDMYIYKVIFQILFASTPVLVFFLMRKYTTPVFAFLSAFFFISFPTFFNDMSMANRQEIGFIFFGLVLYVMLLSNLPLAMRRILFIIFALSVIVSHYSTNFVLLVLATFIYVATLIISWSFVKNTFSWLLAKSHRKLKNTFPNNVFLSLPLIVLLFLMTYTWNSLYTNSSNHVASVVAEVVSNIFVTSKLDSKSADLSYSIFFSPPKRNAEQLLQDYINSTRQSKNAKNEKLYSQSITSKYPVYPVPQEQLAPTALGNLLSAYHIPVFKIQAELRSLSADFMQVFVFIGLLAIIFLKNKQPFDLQYLLLCFGGLFLLALIILLPDLSKDYGVLRMFQQLLFVFALPIVIGFSSVLFFAKEKERILVTGVIAIIFFLNLTGFIAHLTGDYYPQMTLDNAGLYYDAYYVDKSDVVAMIWLSENNVNNGPVDTDLASGQQLLPYGGFIPTNEFFPVVIQQGDYVFLKISTDKAVAFYGGTQFFNSPKSFLDHNKNTIYSNGEYNVYK